MSNFKLDNEKKIIYVLRENRANMSADDNADINFYIGLGYTVKFIDKYPKAPKKTFTVNNAIEYIKVNDKKNLKAFNDIKEEANKLSQELSDITAQYRKAQNDLYTAKLENSISDEEIVKAENEISKLKDKKDSIRNKQLQEQRKAFKKQREYFKDKYGADAYKEVQEMK